MATEYCITYKYTGQINTSSSNRTVAEPNFTLTGDTDRRIGRITRIVYNHYNTSTNGPVVELKGRLHFEDGTYIDSDTIKYDFPSRPEEAHKFVNTFNESLPSPSLFDTWSKIETVLVSISDKSADFYWRATPADPMTIEVYFVEAGVVYYGIGGDWKKCDVYYGTDKRWQQVTPYYGADNVWRSM